MEKCCMFIQNGGVGEEIAEKIVAVIDIATVVCCSLSVFFALVFILLVPVTMKPDLPGYFSIGVFFC